MKDSERIVYGLVITAIIFLTASYVSDNFHLNIDFFPNFFVSLTIELVLSVIAIFALQKYMTYTISIPEPKTLIKPVVYALVATIGINGLMTVLTKLVGGVVEEPPALSKLNALQAFIFIFFYACVAEEMLFHGFLMNLLKPMEKKGIHIFKRMISVPVIISAVAFSLVHLIVIVSGVNIFFVVRIIIFTLFLGLVAGYYQEKYNNHAYAIIVHMTGNSLAVIAILAKS